MITDEFGNIDFQEWNVPTKWDDLTLSKYQDIERFYTENSGKTFNAVEVLHILCDKPIDEVNSLPIQFMETILGKLSFLTEQPDIEPENSIEIDGETYRVATEKTLKFGEYVAADTILKSDKHNYAALLAVLCRKEGEKYDSHFEAEVFDERVKMFEKQPVTKILPIIGFFLTLYGLTTTLSQVYSEVEEAADQLVKNIENSQKLGRFKKRYLSWRMRRILKSLK